MLCLEVCAVAEKLDRRTFLSHSLAAGTAASLGAYAAPAVLADAPSERVTVAVMGLNHGKALAQQIATQPGVRLKYVCDVDSERVAQCRDEIAKNSRQASQGVGDFRRILDDREVDAVFCAAPNHWHAAATVLACSAGKHVYVEKPCSHTPAEGELMIAAARKHNRVVQVGLNRRSSPAVSAALQSLRDGAIGQVYSAMAMYNNLRPSIGVGRESTPPANLDYNLWQGPAPRRPYVDNRIHYNWHWFWHWGNGEIGNNGVHALDICRWGLEVTHPIYVTASGGRYRYEDAQETPDTSTATFTFPEKKEIIWQGWSCSRHSLGRGFVTFIGERGALELGAASGYTIYDENDKVVRKIGDSSSQLGIGEHIADFVAAIRDETPTRIHCDVAEGHLSTMLAHLGNISLRTRRSLSCDPQSGKPIDDPQATKLWQREYEPGWEPRI